MVELLDKKDRAKIASGKKPGGEKGREVLPEVLPFELWSKAWNRFQAILVRRAKALNLADSDKLGEDLAHHMEMVSAIKGKHANWGYYEREFRLLVARGEATWGRSHLELLIHTFLFEESTERDIGARQPTTAIKASLLRNLPSGACFPYQRTGICNSGKFCRYQHACLNCFRAHPVAHCPLPLGNLRVKGSFRQHNGGYRQQGRQFGGPRQQQVQNGGPRQQFVQGQQPFPAPGPQEAPQGNFGARMQFPGTGNRARGAA